MENVYVCSFWIFPFYLGVGRSWEPTNKSAAQLRRETQGCSPDVFKRGSREDIFRVVVEGRQFRRGIREKVIEGAYR